LFRYHYRALEFRHPRLEVSAYRLLLLIRNVAATSLTVIPSENNSAARFNNGGFKSQHDQRMPS
jgi:hypothetical protein